MPKFWRGDKVVVVREKSVFFGHVGFVDSVPDRVWTQTYWVKMPDFDDRPMRFEENELAKVV
jgi:hypothetical protein